MARPLKVRFPSAAGFSDHSGIDHTRVRPKRICLFGMFGGGNFGNDASLESFLLFIREARPDAEVACVCVDP
ncbi:MAG: hypothetical protein KGQ48_17180, partial [Bradyrhizobium sp.]|nr:hypothetical protein [Bradyrhizobium sp.]